MLSDRVPKTNLAPNLLHSAWYRQHSNPYDKNHNPGGIINLGTAENRMVYDIVQEKLNEIDISEMPEEYTHYCKLSGTDQFRDKLSKFFNHYMKPTEEIDREDIYVTNGCGTVLEALGYAICNEGDGILIPAPYYCGFKSDLEQRAKVKTYPVFLTSKPKLDEKPFALTVENLEETLLRAEDEGGNIRALLLSNPNNPLGTIYTEQELEAYVKFCDDYKIHLIVDEIYMQSVYDEKTSFTNVLALKDIMKYRDNVHVVWGFSKDFGLSGFRCGMAITHNKELQSALGSMGYYTSVPTITQYVFEQLITDPVWLEKLSAKYCERLSACSKCVIEELKNSNIEYICPSGGIFIWVNFSKYLKSPKKESEMNFFNTLMDSGIYVVPGSAFECKEPGWFRILISNNVEVLKIAIQRIKKSLAIELFLKSGLKRRSDSNLKDFHKYSPIEIL